MHTSKHFNIHNQSGSHRKPSADDDSVSRARPLKKHQCRGRAFRQITFSRRARPPAPHSTDERAPRVIPAETFRTMSAETEAPPPAAAEGGPKIALGIDLGASNVVVAQGAVGRCRLRHPDISLTPR